MKVIGCDAGGDGALYSLWYDHRGERWRPGGYLVMPMVDVGKRVRQVDIAGVADWIASQDDVGLVAIEEVGYMPPGVGKSGFAGGAYASAILSARYNQLLGMLKTLRRYPYEPVAPQTWKARLKVKVASIKGEKRDRRNKRVKAATAELVGRLYPGAVLIPERCRVVHDGLVDALALAHYAAILAAERVPGLFDVRPDVRRGNSWERLREHESGGHDSGVRDPGGQDRTDRRDGTAAG